MRKFLAACLCLVLLYLLGSYLYFYKGVSFTPAQESASAFVKNVGKKIYLQREGDFEEFEIRGVNMGVGIPGHFATEYAISKEDYLRWFRQIQNMGANTIRVYTILQDDFYDAVYEYNKGNENPLYLLHGLWVNDYIQNSHRDAYDVQFLDVMLNDSKVLVDILHGNRKLSLGRGLGSGSYNRDISPWVIGYILGVEWEDVTVAYTDQLQPEKDSYTGRYLYTTPEATPFEAMLAQVGDQLIAYETKRYGQQRLVAFSNWPTTDPFRYSEAVERHFVKIATVDVEHIKTTGSFVSGVFASYHVYPYYPDYLNYEKDVALLTDSKGRKSTYLTYLKMLADHHTIPVIISEFGVPSSRGMAQKDINTGRNQGGISEKEQGEALVQCYRDIMQAGCAGSAVFSWQEEWFKRTWNTMHAVDLPNTAYWADYQTNEQYFGILAFDPGKERSICYVDGDISEWGGADVVSRENGLEISMKYDEKFLYFMVRDFTSGEFTPGGSAVGESTKLYLPIDITPKSGALSCQAYGIAFDRDADFVIALNGKTDSRVVVQERYDVLRAMYLHETEGLDPYENPPKADSPVFRPIHLMLQTAGQLNAENIEDYSTGFRKAETYETGHLTYGNANPYKEGFNSLADFCYGSNAVEVKLPWQLLNFSNPSEMKIHDDYYRHYGVEEQRIQELYVGAGNGDTLHLSPVKLKGWGKTPAYHERLKESYFALQSVWQDKAGSPEAPVHEAEG